jgi:hypothetical protein
MPPSLSQAFSASSTAAFSGRPSEIAAALVLRARSIFARALNAPGTGRSLTTSPST